MATMSTTCASAARASAANELASVVVALERLTRDVTPREECLPTAAQGTHPQRHWTVLRTELREGTQQAVQIESIGQCLLVTAASSDGDGLHCGKLRRFHDPDVFQLAKRGQRRNLAHIDEMAILGLAQLINPKAARYHL